MTGANSQAATRLDDALAAYDAGITAESTPAVAKLTVPATIDGTAGVPFDFGATSGDVTMEFILAGNPGAAPDGYLAVGEIPTSNLRYAQWQNTEQLGFTQLGVADYLFTPGVPSPKTPSHVAFVWDSANLVMNVYVNGELAGAVTGVAADFAMPSGPGFLGVRENATEAMTGTIYRVTVYSGVLSDAQIGAHADAFANVALPTITSFVATPAEIDPLESAVLRWAATNATALYLNGVSVTGTNLSVSPPVTTTYTLLASNEVATTSATLRLAVNPKLDVYDSAIAADAAAGVAPVALLTNTVNLTGAAGEPFDFGATSGDVTMEFILEGDPTAGPDGYLAVGENTTSSLRYAQWQNTRTMGFTQGGVADYLFSPGVPSPTIATHVTYVWNTTDLTMKLYINGVLAGTVNNVSPDFVMPSGAGFLGANANGGEAMTGRIFRVAVYPGVLPESTITKHANAFTSVLRPPLITSFTAAPGEILGTGSSVLAWQVQDATVVYLNGADVSSLTNQTVTPASTTTYTLVASNAVTTVSAQVRVLVTPVLTNYDAAIASDATNGWPVVAALTNAVTLTGSGGVPFDFGVTSGDVTMEFILEGDPAAGPDGYLAVGENTTSNLRYAQWQNTQRMGFTQLGVADYLFTPEVPSPKVPTHLTFVWNSTETTMSLYTNGVLAGTVTGVTPDFSMPTGAGFLGATPAGGEAMTGRILRVVVYSGIVPEATLQKHADAFKPVTSSPTGPSLALSLSGTQPSITLQGNSGTHYRVEYRDSLSGAQTWQLLQDIPTLSGTSITLADPTTITGRSQRFYRAVVVP